MAQVTQVGARVASKPSFKARFQESVRYAKQWRSHYVFMAPFITLFTIFTIIPVLSSIYLSFTYFNVLQPPKWIGWSNYALLFLEDDIFLIALKNTLVFAIITGPVSFFMQFALAWLINSLKYRTGYTLAFYAPSITSGLVMSNIWKILFSSDMYGYLNYFLTRIGAITQPVLWLQDVDTMMPIVILVSLWMSMGAGFLSFLAGLQNMNEELYEAGRMDGIRNRLQEVWYITSADDETAVAFRRRHGRRKSSGGFQRRHLTYRAAQSVVCNAHDHDSLTGLCVHPLRNGLCLRHIGSAVRDDVLVVSLLHARSFY
ncbi:MAG: carbohydrate ABC transporter permease [Limnochordia bacterium]